jgi:hypothetical protein
MVAGDKLADIAKPVKTTRWACRRVALKCVHGSVVRHTTVEAWAGRFAVSDNRDDRRGVRKQCRRFFLIERGVKLNNL